MNHLSARGAHLTSTRRSTSRPRLLACGGAALLLAACSGVEEPSDADLPAGAVTEQAKPDYSFHMVSTLEPGVETERCKLFVVPEGGLNIRKSDVRFSAGSHHVLLFMTDYATPPAATESGTPIGPDEVIDCPNGASGEFSVVGVVGGAQSSNAPPAIDLPEGVAVVVPEGSILVMNTHYLNATADSLETDAEIDVFTIPDEEVKTEAGILFWYNPFIRVPAFASASARMSCPISKEITLLNAQSHMHKRGKGEEAFLVKPDGKADPLYQSHAWDDVPVKVMDGLKIAAGSAIDFRCDYENPEDRTVLQGLKTTDEMCMFLGAYYPRDTGIEYCAPEGGEFDQLSQNATFIGSGSKSCLSTLQCIANADLSMSDAGDSYFKCVVDSCPAVGPELSSVILCQFTNAGGACDEACSGGDCVACLQKECGSQIDACVNAHCE